jgi:predicted kinase
VSISATLITVDESFGSMSRLIIVAGPPGVGKSFVADEIVEHLDGRVRLFRTDELRAELFEDPTFSSRENQLTYDELFARAREHLDDMSVVLDATFSRKKGRDRAVFVADRHNATIDIVRVHCGDWQEVKRRLESREEDEAGIDVHKGIRRRFEPIFSEHRVDIFNQQSKANTIEQIEQTL